jgi:hypothetical protein
MHVNMVNFLFANVGTNVHFKALDPENIHDIYLDVEVEENMSQCLANLHTKENYVLDLNDISFQLFQYLDHFHFINGYNFGCLFVFLVCLNLISLH